MKSDGEIGKLRHRRSTHIRTFTQTEVVQVPRGPPEPAAELLGDWELQNRPSALQGSQEMTLKWDKGSWEQRSDLCLHQIRELFSLLVRTKPGQHESSVSPEAPNPRGNFPFPHPTQETLLVVRTWGQSIATGF